MDSLPVIFDISSDDEPCCGEPGGDDFDWLSEVLKSVDKPPEAAQYDSDDVVVVSEVNHRKRAKLSKHVEKDFDDDDCMILEGDPEKIAGVVNEAETESDELLIVGEKGQVACRDFPHSRQHCFKFPFKSTPHERHCNLCHCYVCDSIAPCKYWGNGTSVLHHCHATEKEERWKLERESRKKRKSAPPSVPKLPNGSHSMLAQPQHNHVSQINQIRRFNQVPHHNNVQPSTVIRPTSNPGIPNQVSRPTVIRACASSTSNSVIQNQVSKPTVIRPCPSPTNYVTPRVRTNHSSRGYMPQHILARQRHQRHLVGPRSNDFIRKETDHGTGPPTGNTGARFVPSQRTCNSSPTVGGTVLMNQLGQGLQQSRTVVNHVVHEFPQAGTKSHPSRETDDRSGWLGMLGTSTSMSSVGIPQNFPQIITGSVYFTTLPSPTRVQSQHISHSNATENIYQLANPSQNGRNPSFPLPAQIHGNQQPPVDDHQLQSAVPESTNTQLPAGNNQELPDFDFEKWLLDNEPLPPDAPVASMDGGILNFDFEEWLLGNEHVP